MSNKLELKWDHPASDRSKSNPDLRPMTFAEYLSFISSLKCERSAIYQFTRFTETFTLLLK